MARWILVVIFLTVLLSCEQKPQEGYSQPALPGETRDSERISEESRQRLLARISRHGDINDATTPRPLVTLEEFFEGNHDFASIGYNFHSVSFQPAPADFYTLFKTIRAKPEVADVRVEVKDLEEPDGWPATDTVWIIARASAEDIQKWLGPRFRADEILTGFRKDHAMEPYEVPDGMQAFGVWWD